MLPNWLYGKSLRKLQEILNSGGQTAAGVSYSNTESGLEATNAQTAIDEVVEGLNTKVDWDNFSELGAVNMLDFTHASEVRKGYTFTNTDGVVTVTGSRASGETGNADHYVNITLTKGTYKVSGCPSGGSDDTWRLLVNINDGAKYASDYGDGAVFTLTEESSLRVYCTIMANYSDTVNLTFKPMIAPVNYNGPYVPYAKSNKELTDDVATMASKVDADGNGTVYNIAVSDTNYPSALVVSTYTIGALAYWSNALHYILIAKNSNMASVTPSNESSTGLTLTFSNGDVPHIIPLNKTASIWTITKVS